MSDEKAVITHITLVNVNKVSADQEQDLLDNHDADTLDEVAESLSEQMRTLLAHRVFGDSDKIPILDVNTDVKDEYREEDYSDLRQE